MSAQANITVFDGAATPVTHTLIPVDNKVLKDGTRLSIWRENNAAVPVYAQIRFEIYQKSLGTSGVVETRCVSIVPVMESVSGVNAQGYTAAPKVAYEDRSEYRSLSHSRSTVTSRRLCKQILLNLLNNVATTVPAVSAGVVDEAATQLFMPT